MADFSLNSPRNDAMNYFDGAIGTVFCQYIFKWGGGICRNSRNGECVNFLCKL